MAGTFGLTSGFTSVSQTKWIAMEFSDSVDREAYDPLAMEALLRPVPSSAGRQRLLAAIELAEGQILRPKDVLLSESRRSSEGLRSHAVNENVSASTAPEGLMPDFEALAQWQDEVLAATARPTSGQANSRRNGWLCTMGSAPIRERI